MKTKLANFVLVTASTLSALSLPQANLHASPIRTNLSATVDLQQTNPLNRYDFIASINFTPVKLFSSRAVHFPIRLSISCNGVTLSEDSIYFNDRMLKNSFTKTVSVEEIKSKCNAPSAELTLEPNGVELEVDSNSFQQQLVDKGLSTEGTVAKVESDLPAKKIELIKMHALMSSVAGSKTSLYCLVQSYEDDPLMTGVITELKAQYSNLYEPFDNAHESCPVESILAPNIEKCVADSTDASLFCVVYGRYAMVKQWYVDQKSLLRSIEVSLTLETESLRTKIDDLNAAIDRDQEPSSAQIR